MLHISHAKAYVTYYTILKNMTQQFKTIALGVTSGFVGAALFFGVTRAFDTSISPAELVVNRETSPRQQMQFADFNKVANLNENGNFVMAATASTPSVVYIKTVAQGRQTYSWFDMFFDGTNRNNSVLGSGSGVIFTKDGYIMTNHHVINDADKIEVIHNKRTYIAKVIGTDPSTDLALLKVEANNLPAVKVVSATTVNVGDWVLAVGNPFNLTSTVTSGIVSAKGRDIGVLKGQFPLESFIQTDAAINPGNSGGALVNLKGELIGINTAILSQTGSYSGYGFAVPSDIVGKIYNDLKQFGQVQKAFMGVQVADVSEENYQNLALPEISGVVINTIEEDGAAARAGLQRNDVLLKINGKPIASRAAYDEQLSYYKPADKITVQLSRNGKIVEKIVELTNINGTTSVTKKEVYKAESLNAEFELVPKGERSRLGIANGVRIVKVNNGFLAQVGFEEGFIVTSVNNVEVDSPQKLAYLLENTRGRVIVRGINKQGVASYYSYVF